MMYKDKFVLAVKNDGKILREFKESVYLPFGSEYSLYLKNLNTVRALARVWIDGQIVTEDVDLIVPANGHIDLERFIRKGNLEQGNKFKFIERTEAVENFRGIKAEDGLVRIEFRFEQLPAPVTIWGGSSTIYTGTHGGQGGTTFTTGGYHTINTTDTGTKYKTMNHGSGQSRRSNTIGEISECCNDSFTYTNCSATIGASGSSTINTSYNANDVGITAAGSLSDQHFTIGSHFATETEAHTIILKLLGKTDTVEVIQAVTVKLAPKCTSCGRKNKNTAKFCAECGTALYII